MDKLKLLRRAVADIGNVSATELSAHLEKKYGVKIEPAFIPIFNATLLYLATGRALPSSVMGVSFR